MTVPLPEFEHSPEREMHIILDDITDEILDDLIADTGRTPEDIISSACSFYCFLRAMRRQNKDLYMTEAAPYLEAELVSQRNRYADVEAEYFCPLRGSGATNFDIYPTLEQVAPILLAIKNASINLDVAQTPTTHRISLAVGEALRHYVARYEMEADGYVLRIHAGLQDVYLEPIVAEDTADYPEDYND